MGNAFYDEMAAVAVELLADAEFGATLSLTRTTGGTLNPVTGVISGASTSTLSVHAAEMQINQEFAKLLGGTVEQNDKLIIADPQVQLLLTDKITLDGALYGMVKIVPYNPAGTPVAYLAQLRR